MTELFIIKPWLKMPSDWFNVFSTISYAELQQLIECNVVDNWPASLKQFCSLVKQFNERYDLEWKETVNIPEHMKKGMGCKKQHEIKRMIPFIKEKFVAHKCTLVADIGCGLGYLGNALTSLYNIDVKGFELRASNCQSARNYTSDSSSFATEQLIVDKSIECTKAIQTALTYHDKTKAASVSSKPNPEQLNLSSSPLRTRSSDQRICMVGLHCCGDLTPATLFQFHHLDECKVLICLGCCYHRLCSENKTSFENFPLSMKLKTEYDFTQPNDRKLNGLALRLACQETKSRWLCKTEQEVNNHSKHVAFRAVLEYYCWKTGSSLTKKHKKLTGSAAFKTFETYIDAVLSRVDDFSPLDSIITVRQDLLLCYEECKPYFSCVMWYNALQVMMQGVLESLILRDRKEYLLELGIHCQLISLFDDEISPRNIALLAWK